MVRDKHAIPKGEVEANLNDYLETTPKRGKGRPPGFRMSEAHRIKIQNSQILNRLLTHFESEPCLTDSQVKVGLGLLKKVLPDLQSMTIAGDPNAPLSLDIRRIERVVTDPKG